MAFHLEVLEMRLAHSVKTSLGLLSAAFNLAFARLGAVTAYQVKTSTRVRHMMDDGWGKEWRASSTDMNLPLA
jgi:hypothetical protein